MASAEPAKKVWTEADLEALPDDGCLHEVVQGALIVSLKNNWQHGEICARMLMALKSYADRKRQGAVWDSSTGFWMANRNCRTPDVSFVSKERLRGLNLSEAAFFEGAPDLTVEILSPTDTRREMVERVRDYFASGCRLVWMIDPKARRVEIVHPPAERRTLDAGSTLEGEDVQPGFACPIADLFREWDW